MWCHLYDTVICSFDVIVMWNYQIKLVKTIVQQSFIDIKPPRSAFFIESTIEHIILINVSF